MKNIVYLFVLAVCIGCSKEQPKGRVSQERSQKDDKVIISVGSRCLTVQQLKQKVEMMLKFQQLQNPQMKISEVSKLRKSLMSSYGKFFIEQSIWANYAEREHIEIDPKLLERTQQRAVKMVYPKKKVKYSSFRSKFGNLSSTLDDHVKMMALSSTVRKSVADANPTNIPAEYVSNTIARLKKYNDDVARTNIFVFAQATNCWEQLKAGADFKKMVQEFSELTQERKDGGVWGTLDFQQLEPDPLVLKYARTLEPGAFSPPIEGDNGLMILRLDSRKESECTLSRIFFRLPMFADVPTADEIVRHEENEHKNRVIKSLYRKLYKAEKIIRSNDGKDKKKSKKSAKADQQKQPAAVQSSNEGTAHQSVESKSEDRKSVV